MCGTDGYSCTRRACLLRLGWVQPLLRVVSMESCRSSPLIYLRPHVDNNASILFETLKSAKQVALKYLLQYLHIVFSHPLNPHPHCDLRCATTASTASCAAGASRGTRSSSSAATSLCAATTRPRPGRPRVRGRFIFFIRLAHGSLSYNKIACSLSLLPEMVVRGCVLRAHFECYPTHVCVTPQVYVSWQPVPAP